MIKVILWNRDVLFMDDEFQERVEAIMGSDKKVKLKHLDGDDTIIGRAIARVTKAQYREYGHKLPVNPRQIEAPKPPERTEEQLEANRARIKQMKDDFIARRNRKEANHGSEEKI